MVKANRLYNRIESFAALFWALGNVLVHILKQGTQPAGLASLNRRTSSDCTAGVRLVQYDMEEELPPPISPLDVHTLCSRIKLYCKQLGQEE